MSSTHQEVTLLTEFEFDLCVLSAPFYTDLSKLIHLDWCFVFAGAMLRDKSPWEIALSYRRCQVSFIGKMLPSYDVC